MKSFQLKYIGLIGLIAKKGKRCDEQAIVTGALFDVKCHRDCVFVSLSMPIKKTRNTRLVFAYAKSRFSRDAAHVSIYISIYYIYYMFQN